MAIDNVSSVNKVYFKGKSASNQNIQQPKQEYNSNNGKKLALTLGCLAVAGVTMFALYKSGKLSNLRNGQNVDTRKPTTDIINDINAEVQQRTKQAENAIKNAQEAQARFMKPFDDKLSNKSAEESAQALDELLAEQAQDKFNKPFKDKLSGKKAKNSARVFMEQEYKARDKIALPDSPEFAQDLKNACEHGQIIDPTKYGFSAEGKWHTFADGSKALVYEGPGLYDITSDGRLLVKEYENWYKAILNGEQPRYVDCTNLVHDGVNFAESLTTKAAETVPNMVFA